MKELSEFLKHLKGLFSKKKDIEEIKEEKAISPVEEEILLGVINLKGLELGDFLLPRPDIVWLEQSMSWDKVKLVLAQNPHHYYPVYAGTVENYSGYVSLKDLVRGINLQNFNWTSYIRPPLTLPKTLSIVSALEKMRLHSVEMVFLVDENSELIGVVLLKDIIDEIFFMRQECPAKTEEGSYIFPGKIKLRVVERCLNINLPEGEYDTLSGLIMKHYNGIPKAGANLTFETFDIEILDADERKIKLVKLKPKT